MRNSIKIRMWMIQNKVRQVTIQRDLGFKSHKVVWSTISGEENNRKVLSWFLDKGCPRNYLGIPDDIEEAA